MALPDVSRLLPWNVTPPAPFAFVVSKVRSRRVHCVLIWSAAGITLLAAGLIEARSSWLQSRLFSALARRMTFTLAKGPSGAIRYTRTGPYDQRLGYSHIPEFLQQSASVGYVIQAQARPSRLQLAISDLGLHQVYQEKGQAGLQILDSNGKRLYDFRYPERVYRDYSEIPKIIVDTLLFIENRSLLDPAHPTRNPTVEWHRLSHAVLDYAAHAINPRHPVIGASTLATQLEKMRHSPSGRTHSAREKMGQMLSASLRAYQEGPHTLATQRRIIRDYLNALPLGAAPGAGEITGLGDGLWAWYGMDFDSANLLLRTSPASLDSGQQIVQARAFREILSLILAARSPFRYLVLQPDLLAEQTDRYLRVLCNANLISMPLRNLALGDRPALIHSHAVPVRDFVDSKAPDMARRNALSILGLNDMYALDRLDLSVVTTIDGTAQRKATHVLRGLADPAKVAKAHLLEPRLLAHGDPHRVIYSFTLYERESGMNLLRVQTDNCNQPLSINEHTKLQLGSTAKLRTLINYLQIVEQLHTQFAQVSLKQLRMQPVACNDPLTGWALSYLATASDKTSPAMLKASLDRRYSASPSEAFFTGGGLHHFRNFDSADDARQVSVREAFERSVNLVFIRLMRDIERYYMCRPPNGSNGVLLNAAYPERRRYLARFADQEGKVFLARFYRKYAGFSPDDALEKLSRRGTATPQRLAVIYRSVRPGATLEEFTGFLHIYLPPAALVGRTPRILYERYASSRFNLQDRGYLARAHPLELWLVEYLQEHSGAEFAKVVRASVDARQQAYLWLFRTRHKRAQDWRIRILLEEDVFQQIGRAWRQVGYPFERLVPSYATAIGVSGDTPAALAETVGIVLNRGVRNPHTAISQLRFAEGTPMDTVLRWQPGTGSQVMSNDIAALVYQEMIRVVEKGTARRGHGTIVRADGSRVPLGGKTGTGDNRVKAFAVGGRVRESRAANRTAAFVFVIGDRFFGTVMVFVPGSSAGTYEFTSSLAVQVFKELQPALRPMLND